MVQLLLEKGANGKAASRSGMIALIMAVDGGNDAVVHLLLQRGADVEIKNSVGQTSLEISKKLNSPLPNHHNDEKQREEIQRIMKAVSELLKSQSAQAIPSTH